MPIWFEITTGALVLWGTVYSLSYAVFELKQKRPKSGMATILMVAAMVSAFLVFIL